MKLLLKKIADARNCLLLTVLSVMALLSATSAQAGCSLASGFVTKIIQMDVGTVVIPNDAPVGTVFFTKQFNIPITPTTPAQALKLGVSGVSPNGEVAWICTGGGSTNGRIIQPAAVQVPNMLDGNVFTTNVAGVGIRLSRQIQGQGSRYYPHTLIWDASTPWVQLLSPTFFIVELVKIAANTGSGPLSSGTYTTYEGDGGGGSAITTVLSGNGITIIRPPCTVDAGSKNVVVNFGAISRGRFKGVGSTAGDRPFNIKLTCQTSGNGALQNLAVTMNAMADPSNSPGVTQLTQEVGVATGVGIQVLDQSSQPVVFGTAATVGALGNTSYVVPFTARYYQTAPNITTGPANGTATFTITYQ